VTGKQRQKKRTASTKERFLAAFRDCGRVDKAAETVKVARWTVYRWARDDERFAEEMEKARDTAAGLLEDEAVRRAREGVIKPIFHNGIAVGAVREYSDTLLIFLLKCWKPGRYRDNISHQHSGPSGGAIPFAGILVQPEDLKKTDDEDLDALRRVVENLGAHRASDAGADRGGTGSKDG
jgi:hypothetical protein